MFLCTIDPHELTGLTTRLQSMIDVRTDAVHLVPLCGACWDRITVLGQATVAPEQLYWAVL